MQRILKAIIILLAFAIAGCVNADLKETKQVSYNLYRSAYGDSINIQTDLRGMATLIMPVDYQLIRHDSFHCSSGDKEYRILWIFKNRIDSSLALIYLDVPFKLPGHFGRNLKDSIYPFMFVERDLALLWPNVKLRVEDIVYKKIICESHYIENLFGDFRCIYKNSSNDYYLFSRQYSTLNINAYISAYSRNKLFLENLFKIDTPITYLEIIPWYD
jgi:hypothetical protein